MKTDNLHIRIDPERKELFRQRADEMGLSISDYFEHLMDEKPMDRIQVKSDLQAVKYELAKIGNNLNQIARDLNGEHYHFPEDAAKVNTVIGELKQVLDQLLETHT